MESMIMLACIELHFQGGHVMSKSLHLFKDKLTEANSTFSNLYSSVTNCRYVSKMIP